MQEIKYPCFKKGRILKIEMLENLRDFPRNVLNIYCENMTDGLLYGFTPLVNKNSITFSKGISKYKGRLYVMQEAFTVFYTPTEAETFIKLKFTNETINEDDKRIQVDIITEENPLVLENQQELGRFKLKKGALLRSNYQDLGDFITEYNTLNIVNVLYAGQDEQTISVQILRYFAKEVLKLKPQNPADLSFCFLCLNSNRVEREVIKQYFAYRSDTEINIVSNAEIHRWLVKIAEELKLEKHMPIKRNRMTNKIMVD